jgi:hypothetical protein
MFDKFIYGTINQVTMAAALRRSNTYNDSTTDKQKRDFRNDLCEKLKELSTQYKNNNVTERCHLTNIKSLQEYANKNHKKILKKGKLKYGVAQKALNLYLKLLWSIKKIKEPAHCPIDSIIINKLPKDNYKNWTEITTEKQYLKIIKAIRKAANESKLSIAKWELKVYGKGLQE